MTNNQESMVDMHLIVINFSGENVDVSSNLPGYNNNLSILADTNFQIQSIGIQQGIDLSGISSGKKVIKESLVQFGADTSRKLTSFAILTNNYTLQGEVSFSETELRRMSDIKLSDTVQIIFNKAQENLVSLVEYQITEATQISLQNNISSFNSVITAPRIGVTNKKQTTKQLVPLFKTAKAALSKMDTSVEIVRVSNPNFYNGYKSVRKIISKGTSKLAVKGLVTDTQNGEPIKGVTVLFTLDGGQAKMTASTNGQSVVVKTTAAKGGFNIQSIAAGTYGVSFKKAGYAEQTATVNVNDGEMSLVEVMMVKN